MVRWVRFLNRCVIGIQNRLLKNAAVLGYPPYVFIDICNLCSMHCVLCPTGTQSPARSQGMMDFDSFKRIADRLCSYVGTIDFTNWGDAFLNSDFLRMVRYAKSKRIKCMVSSVLNKVTEDNAEEIVRSGLDEIQVGIHGITQETAQIYQRGVDLARVFRVVRAIASSKEALLKKKPYLKIKFLVSRHSEHQMSDALKLRASLGADEIFFAPIGPMKDDALTRGGEFQYEQIRDWLPRLEAFNVGDPERKTIKEKHRIPCDFLWKSTVINWNGSVGPCCAYHSEAYDFGNIFETDFAEIWNGSKYRAARALLGRGKMPAADLDLICRRCAVS